MMDWSGKVSREYDYIGRQAMVLVITPKGSEKLRVMGPANEKNLKECIKALDGVLSSAPEILPSSEEESMEQDKAHTDRSNQLEGTAESNEREKDDQAESQPVKTRSSG